MYYSPSASSTPSYMPSPSAGVFPVGPHHHCHSPLRDFAQPYHDSHGSGRQSNVQYGDSSRGTDSRSGNYSKGHHDQFYYGSSENESRGDDRYGDRRDQPYDDLNENGSWSEYRFEDHGHRDRRAIGNCYSEDGSAYNKQAREEREAFGTQRKKQRVEASLQLQTTSESVNESDEVVPTVDELPSIRPTWV